MPSPEATEMWSLRSYTPGSAATRAWQVAYATTEADAINAVATLGVFVGAKYPYDPNLAIATGGIVAECPGFSMWVVRANYALGSFDSPPDKTSQRPKFFYSFGNISENADVSPDGLLYRNSTGQPIQALLEYGTIFLTVKRWVNRYNLAQAVQYQNAVNSDVVNLPLADGTLYPGQMKCLFIVPTQEFDGTATVLEVQSQFEMRGGNVQDGDGRWDGFKFRGLDKGEKGFFDNNGTLTKGHFRSRFGEAISVLLDGTGLPFLSTEGYTVDGHTPAPAKVALDNNVLEKTIDGVYLKFPKTKFKPFSALGIF